MVKEREETKRGREVKKLMKNWVVGRDKRKIKQRERERKEQKEGEDIIKDNIGIKRERKKTDE